MTTTTNGPEAPRPRMARPARGGALRAGLILAGMLASRPAHGQDRVEGMGRVVGVVAGDEHTCAIGESGALWCWGANAHGQLGAPSGPCRIGERRSTCSTRALRVPGLGDIVEVALGRSHTCARSASGQVRCWGANGLGQLGDGGSTDRTAPALVPNLPVAVGIAAGSDGTCALLEDRTVRCWGLVPGAEYTAPWRVPSAIVGLDHVAEIGLGQAHACALGDDRLVRCWGTAAWDPLWWTTTPARAPVVNVSDFVVVGDETYVRAGTERRVYHWRGQGERMVGDAALADTVEIAPGRAQEHNGSHLCARTEAGTVLCRGDNVAGQTGARPIGGRSQDDLRAVPDLPRMTQLSLGNAHSCARSRDGDVWCWGAGDQGQRGDGTLRHQGEPGRVQTTGEAAIAPPSTQSLAVVQMFERQGSLHVPPMRVTDASVGLDGWLLAFGPREVATVVWWVPAARARDIQVIRQWPVGMRVAGVVTRDAVAYVLLESTGAQGVAAGRHFVAAIDPVAATMVPPDATAVVLSGAIDAASLTERAASLTSAGRPPSVDVHPAPDAAFARASAARGVELVRVWDELLVEHSDHVDRDAPSDDPRLPPVRAALARADAIVQCSPGGICVRASAEGAPALGFVLAEDQGRFALFGLASYGTLTSRSAAPAAAPRLVAPMVVGDEVRRAFTFASGANSVTVLAQSRLDDRGGLIGVGCVGPSASERHLSAVLIEGGVVRLSGLEDHCPPDADGLRFGDFDGDGRTDLFFRLPQAQDRSSELPEQGVALASATGPFAPALSEAGHAYDLALLPGVSVDGVVARLLTTPLEPVTTAEACSLLRRARSASSVRRVSVEDVRVFGYEAYGHPQVGPAHPPSAEDLRRLYGRIPEVCHAQCTTSYCVIEEGPSMTFWWFARRGRRLRLRGYAAYWGE